jgi:serine/threonine-protein kinase
VAGSFCPSAPTCWGGLVVISGTLQKPRKVACDSDHYWETFAGGYLPADAAEQSMEDVAARPDMKQACSAQVLAARGRAPAKVKDWLVEVLPIQADGRLTYQCAAGPPEGGEHTGSAFRPA